MNSDSIPIDLIVEILLRLPAKSIARFNCVSKLWASILGRPYFTELFLTRSSAQPRLLFTIEGDGVWSFFSLPQRQNPYEKPSSSPSLVVAAEFHMKFPPENMRIYYSQVFSCGYACGLIYFYPMYIKEEDYYGVPVICNPNTGRYATLPFLHRHRKHCDSFFGFDPINKQFKVLFMGYPRCTDGHKILTLGTGKTRWRNIKCPLVHDPLSYTGICINGVLYYIGRNIDYLRSDVVDGIDETFAYVIVCFDVRFEKFKFIGVENYCQLIKYKGKLGVGYWKDDFDDTELRLWVLEDAEKQEWSKYAYTLWDDKFLVENNYVSIHVVGVTATGEIILSMGTYISKQAFYVFYFNPERNILRSVEIQGFDEYHHEGRKKSSVYTFANHVEDLNVNDAKLLNSSIYAPYVKKEELEDEEEEQENEKEMKRKRI